MRRAWKWLKWQLSVKNEWVLIEGRFPMIFHVKKERPR